jgi:hypothetical protein
LNIAAKTKTPATMRAGVSKQASLDDHDEIQKSNPNVLSIARGRSGYSWDAPSIHFARVPAGTYDAVAVNIQGPEKVRRYGRWSLRIGFQLLSDPVEVSMYLNFGKGEKPVIARHGRFFEAWVLVNGDVPRLDQRMNPDIFLDSGLLYTVLVVDAATSSERLQKPDAMIYSRVEKILKVVHP